MSVNSFNASNPPLTTKGDLYGFSTVPARVPVGTNGQVLTADSTATNGVAWATAASGGMTLIATGTGTGSSTTISFSSIASTYKHLMLVFEEVRTNYGSTIKINYNSSTADYDFRFGGTDTTNDNGAAQIFTFKPALDGDAATSFSNGVYWIYNYSGSQTNKNATGLWAYTSSSGANNGYRTGTSRWRNTAAISSIQIGNSGGDNFGTATVIKLYGVS